MSKQPKIKKCDVCGAASLEVKKCEHGDHCLCPTHWDTPDKSEQPGVCGKCYQQLLHESLQ